jgi:hypothetical protein
LPVEQPKKFEFVINLESGKTDRTGNSVEVLARASRLIK